MTNHQPDFDFRREILNRHLIARGAKPDHGPIDHLYVTVEDAIAALNGGTILANEELGTTREFAKAWSTDVVPLAERAVDRGLICRLSYVPWAALSEANPDAFALQGPGQVWWLARAWEEGTSLTIVKHGPPGEMDCYEVRAIRHQDGHVALLLVEHGRAVVAPNGPVMFTTAFMPPGCDPAERVDHASKETLRPVALALAGMHDARCRYERGPTGITLDATPLILGKLDS